MVVPHFPEIGVELGFDRQGIGKIVQSARWLGNSIGSKKQTTNTAKQEDPHGAKLLPRADFKKKSINPYNILASFVVYKLVTQP
jgi:hypothetical protein